MAVHVCGAWACTTHQGSMGGGRVTEPYRQRRPLLPPSLVLPALAPTTDQTHPQPFLAGTLARRIIRQEKISRAVNPNPNPNPNYHLNPPESPELRLNQETTQFTQCE